VVYPPVVLGLIVLGLASFARRRALAAAEIDEVPEPSL
jgi:hypothetical protein